MNRNPISATTTRRGGVGTRPWYVQFWPWFLIAIPLLSVIGGVITFILASRDPYSLVIDDYYRQGLAINRVLARDRRAAELNLRAQISIDAEGLQLRLLGDALLEPLAVDISFLHPTRSIHDRNLRLSKIDSGTYWAPAPAIGRGHWHIRVEPDEGAWRLSGRVHWPENGSITLTAGGS